MDLNEERGYYPSTGIFTAPAPEVYVFDWTTQRGKHAYTSLIVNGKFKSWNLCHDDASKLYDSCSKMTAVKLKHGEKVWIGVFNGPANIDVQYTLFSGYKL